MTIFNVQGRLYSHENNFIIFTSLYVLDSSNPNCFNLHYLLYFLDNGVMSSPKRRDLLFAFSFLCTDINNINKANTISTIAIQTSILSLIGGL